MISFVIPTMTKTKKYLDLCVSSIKENSLHNNYEIIVCPNGEGTDYPQGQWMAVNRGVKDAKGEWIFLINDDMYLPRGWDRNLTAPSECFSPNVNWTHDPVAGLGYVVLEAGRTIEEFNREAVDSYMKSLSTNMIENGFHFPVIFSKRIWDKVGGFDENYDPWGSNGDSDFEYKMVLAGVQPKIHNGVLVYHFGGKAETFTPDKQSYWQKNWDYFIEKWGFEREDTPRIQRADLRIDLNKLKYLPEWRKI